jgi:hypothetical protein
MIENEYIREHYYNDVKTLFFNFLNIYNISHSNKKRYFGVFINLLYFHDKHLFDDVLVKIYNKKSFIFIKQYLNYDNLIYKPFINETKLFIIKWNNITDDYIKKIKSINNNDNNNIIIKKNKFNVNLTYNNNTLIVLTNIYNKLLNLMIHKKNNNMYIYILIYRYKYFNLLYDNNQLALHQTFKHTLQKKYNINTELFASPFNCYYINYYSLFPILEANFGSKGRFNNIKKLDDIYYFSNPPFEEEIISLVSDKYIKFMNKFNTKFITTIPIWDKKNKKKIIDNENINIFLETDYNDYIGFKKLIPYIKKYTIYKKQNIPYFNYIKNKTIYASDTYLLILYK